MSRRMKLALVAAVVVVLFAVVAPFATGISMFLVMAGAQGNGQTNPCLTTVAAAASPPASDSSSQSSTASVSPSGASTTPAAPPSSSGPAATPISAVMPTSGPSAHPVVASLPASVGDYKGTQVEIAAQIIKMGQTRHLDAKTITLAVMTAMGESTLINVPHGDKARSNTIGVFQEGPERGSYADRMNPAPAAGIFYDYLLRVPNYLTLEPTIAAHKAQSNADPYYYRPFWAPAVQMVAALTADPSLLAALPMDGGVSGCVNGVPVGAGELGPPGSGNGSGAAIVAAAEKLLGVPYSWGGGDAKGPTLGFYETPVRDGSHTVGVDCSGLVIAAVAQATGIVLSHSAEDQGHDSRGRPVPRDWAQMQPGDVVAFSENGTGARGSFGHVGIYIGGGKMIHAPRRGKPVQIVQLQGVAYYESMAWSIRRYARGTAA